MDHKYSDLAARLENIELLLKSQALYSKTFFNIDEVAIYTGLSKQYIYKLTSGKAIPYFKAHGKNIFFKKDEIDKWVLSNRQSTNEEIEIEAINHSVFKK